MKLWWLGLVLTPTCVFACSPPAIPPPVEYPRSTTSLDEHSAKPNPANEDPRLKPPFGPFDVQTVFYIAKSNDKDRIDYGMRLDQHCAPVGANAVFPYWRIFEQLPVYSHPLTFLQYAAYGLSKQRVLEKSEHGGKYQVELERVKRPIVIVTKQDEDSHCTATAYATVNGVKGSRLNYIFAKVAGMMSVDYVDVHGTDPSSGQPLTERMKP